MIDTRELLISVCLTLWFFGILAFAIPYIHAQDIRYDYDEGTDEVVQRVTFLTYRATLNAWVKGHWQYGYNYYIFSYHGASREYTYNGLIGTGFKPISPLYLWGRALKDPDQSIVKVQDWNTTSDSIEKRLPEDIEEYYQADWAQTSAKTRFVFYQVWDIKYTVWLEVPYDSASVHR